MLPARADVKRLRMRGSFSGALMRNGGGLLARGRGGSATGAMGG